MTVLNKIVLRITYKFFQLKRKILGQYYWVGPETEIGVCCECADLNPVGYELQKKVPTRRLIPEDNLYLCRDHWEKARNNPDCVPLEPFIRTVK